MASNNIVIDALDYLLGSCLEFASSLRETIGYLPSILITIIIQIIVSYLLVRTLKSPYRYIALILFNIFGLGFLFFIELSEGMSKQW